MSLYDLKLAEIIKAPVVSEKSTMAGEESNTVVFKVQRLATKKQVKDAVELMFDVKVDTVRVLNVKGKVKRFGRNLGKRQDWKKAYVKLMPDYDIEFTAA
jgi:large subunit ribosomal protein L23